MNASSYMTGLEHSNRIAFTVFLLTPWRGGGSDLPCARPTRAFSGRALREHRGRSLRSAPPRSPSRLRQSLLRSQVQASQHELRGNPLNQDTFVPATRTGLNLHRTGRNRELAG